MYKTKQKLLFLSLVLLTIFSISNVIGVDYNTDSCWDTGNITDNMNIYLTTDIISTDSNGCFDLRNDMENVVIDCQGNSITNTNYASSSAGFHSWEGFRNNLTIKNCYITDFGENGIELTNFSDVTISNMIFNNNQVYDTGSAIGVQIIDDEFNDGLIIEDCIFNTTNTENGSFRAIDSDRIDNMIIRNNEFHSNWNGTHYVGGVLYLRTSGTEFTDNFSFYGNEFYNDCEDVYENDKCLNLIVQDDSKFINVNINNNSIINSNNFFSFYDGSTETYAISNLNMYDNYFNNISETPINLDNLENINISDNNFYNIDSIGISLININNLILSNNYFNNITKQAIYLDYIDNLVVSYNNMTDIGSLSNSFVNGLDIKNSNNVTFHHNYLRNYIDGQFAGVFQFQYVNNLDIYENEIYNATEPNFYNGYIGYYLRTVNNTDFYNNKAEDILDLTVRVRDSIGIVKIHNNDLSTSNYNTHLIDIRNSQNVEVYNENFVGNNYTKCFRLRDNSPNNYFHDNSCEDSAIGLVFRESGTYTNNVIVNNTLTNNDIGIEFKDLGEILDLSSNNIYANTINVQSGTNVVLIGNYYNDGDVNSSEGFCLTQPYTEGNVTDNFAYCCLNGFNDGCSYTPIDLITGYVPSYVNDDIPKATINMIVKAIISFSLVITIIVFVILYSYMKRKFNLKRIE